VFLIVVSLILARFGEMYKNAIVEYKTNYFKERSAFSLFTRYMIGRGQDFISLYYNEKKFDFKGTASRGRIQIF
jgi:hypothetical protein